MDNYLFGELFTRATLETHVQHEATALKTWLSLGLSPHALIKIFANYLLHIREKELSLSTVWELIEKTSKFSKQKPCHLNCLIFLKQIITKELYDDPLKAIILLELELQYYVTILNEEHFAFKGITTDFILERITLYKPFIPEKFYTRIRSLISKQAQWACIEKKIKDCKEYLKKEKPTSVVAVQTTAPSTWAMIFTTALLTSLPFSNTQWVPLGGGATGSPIVRVNDGSIADALRTPDISLSENGSLIAVWSAKNAGLDPFWGVRARCGDIGGNFKLFNILINTNHTNGSQNMARIDGNDIVFRDGANSDGDATGITKGGVKNEACEAKPQKQVNKNFTSGFQTRPDVAKKLYCWTDGIGDGVITQVRCAKEVDGVLQDEVIISLTPLYQNGYDQELSSMVVLPNDDGDDDLIATFYAKALDGNGLAMYAVLCRISENSITVITTEPIGQFSRLSVSSSDDRFHWGAKLSITNNGEVVFTYLNDVGNPDSFPEGVFVGKITVSGNSLTIKPAIQIAGLDDFISNAAIEAADIAGSDLDPMLLSLWTETNNTHSVIRGRGISSDITYVAPTSLIAESPQLLDSRVKTRGGLFYPIWVRRAPGEQDEVNMRFNVTLPPAPSTTEPPSTSSSSTQQSSSNSNTNTNASNSASSSTQQSSSSNTNTNSSSSSSNPSTDSNSASSSSASSFFSSSSSSTSTSFSSSSSNPSADSNSASSSSPSGNNSNSNSNSNTNSNPNSTLPTSTSNPSSSFSDISSTPVDSNSSLSPSNPATNSSSDLSSQATEWFKLFWWTLLIGLAASVAILCVTYYFLRRKLGKSAEMIELDNYKRQSEQSETSSNEHGSGDDSRAGYGDDAASGITAITLDAQGATPKAAEPENPHGHFSGLRRDSGPLTRAPNTDSDDETIITVPITGDQW